MDKILKFRAYDKAHKVIKPCNLYSINNLNGKITHVQLHGDSFMKVIGLHVELMQFTGWSDKAGKEIYEGDVIKTQYGNICEVRWCHVKEYKTKDLFEYLGFGAFELKQQLAYHLDSNATKAEVIGNIYQNPELLIQS
jgi:uncharacterized phage protein (TIGR01671 family)